MDTTQVPAGYKVTELGVLPEEWEVSELKSLLSSRPDYGINAAAVKYSDTLPTYLRITDISENGQLLTQNKVSVNHPLVANYFLAPDDIVFARTGASTGKTYLHTEGNGRLVFAGFLIRIRTDSKKLNPYFLKAYTETATYWKWVAMTSMRSGQPGINGVEYSKLNIPLPPIAEQQAIAAALGEMDALLAAQRARLAKQRAVKQGLLQGLLSGEKRLPGFAGEWEVKRLGDIAHTFSGGTPNTSNLSFYGGDISWITSSDLNSSRIKEVVGRITKQGLKLSSAKMVRRNTLLIALYGATAGVTALTEIEGAINQAVLAIEPFSDSNEFLFYQLTRLKAHIINTFTQGGQPNLSGAIVKAVTIPIPQIDEQRAIADVLTEADAHLAALEAEHAKTQLLKQGMMQNLLTGKIRLV